MKRFVNKEHRLFNIDTRSETTYARILSVAAFLIVYCVFSFCFPWQSAIQKNNKNILCHGIIQAVGKDNIITLKTVEYDNNSLQKERQTASGKTNDYGFSDELSDVMEQFYELIDGIGTDNLTVEIGVEGAIASLVSLLRGEQGRIGVFLLMLFGASLLLLVGERLGDCFGDSRHLALAGVGAVLSIPIVSRLADLVFSVRDGLIGATELFSGLIPIFGAISAISGATTTSFAQSAGMTVTLSVCSVIIKDGLLPAVMLMLALGLLTSFDIGGLVAPVAKGIKGAFTFILGAVTTATAGALALQSVISNAQDSMALRGAKFAVSGMIPMVGGSVSSALGALASGVNIARGTVGATSLTLLISILAAPLAELLLVRVCFRLCISFLEMTGGVLGAKILSSLQGVLDALISVLAFSGLIFSLEVIIFLKLGVAEI